MVSALFAYRHVLHFREAELATYRLTGEVSSGGLRTRVDASRSVRLTGGLCTCCALSDTCANPLVWCTRGWTTASGTPKPE